MANNKIIFENSSNKVGIGTTNPTQKMYLGGETDTRLQLDSTTTQGIYFTKSANNNGTFRVDTNGNFEWYTKTVSQAMVLNANGNMGIGGVTNPTVPIHAFKSNTSGSQAIVLGVCSDSLRPVIQFSEGADVNFGTGMGIEYDGRGSGGTNALRFNSVDNVPVQTFMSNGWVGFGNTSPTAPLFVQHTNLPGEPYTGIYIKNTDTTGAAYTGVTSDGVLQSHYRFALNGALKWQWRTGAGSGVDDLRAYSFTLGNDVMTMTAAGSVGIGITNPTNTHLWIRGDWVGGHSTIKVQGITDNTTGIGFYNTSATRVGYVAYTSSGFEWFSGVDAPTAIYTNSAARITILGGGNVGIGITNPSTKLDVNGGALIRGNLSLNNNSFSNFTIDSYGDNVIRPASNSYGGFQFKTFDGSAAGYFLIRDTTDVDVYREYGVTLVTDRGPVTLAARGSTIGNNSDRNFIRFMTAGGGDAQVRMTINKNGQITMPYQPVFYAYGNRDNTHVSPSYVRFDIASVNVGSHYNPATGRFTAPVTGSYYFFFGHIGSTADTVYRFNLYKNEAGSTLGELRLDASESGSAYVSNASRGIIVNLTAGDYVSVYYTSDNGSSFYPGTNTDSNAFIHFGGYLIG